MGGARKVGIMPHSFILAPAAGNEDKFIFSSLTILKEYELLKRVRNEDHANVAAAIDKPIYSSPENRITEPSRITLSLTRERAGFS